MKQFTPLIILLTVNVCIAQYDALRIENEIKLTVPTELSDSVWEYLTLKYDNANLYLKEIDSSFNCKMAVDSITDQYFDDGNLRLLNMNSGVRHRSRFVLTDKTNRKHGRELMQVKINNVGSSELNRGEYKYKIKHYDNKEESIDYHPFLGIVHKNHRADITERLKEYEINAADLFPTIKITQIRKRIYVYKGAAPFATLTLDYVTASYDQEEKSFIELELELNEKGYTESNPLLRKEMEQVNETMKSDILKQFPSINQDQTPKYNKAATLIGLTEKTLTRASILTTIPIIYWIIGGLFLLLIVLIVMSIVKHK